VERQLHHIASFVRHFISIKEASVIFTRNHFVNIIIPIRPLSLTIVLVYVL